MNEVDKVTVIKNRIEELRNKRCKIQQIIMDFDEEIEILEKSLQKFNI